MAKRNETVQGRLVAAIQKSWGPGAAMTLGEDQPAAQTRMVIPSGIEVFDGHVLGLGGWPVGRISELFSDEGAGKTSIALATCAEVQAMGGLAVFIDMEHALHPERAATLGVSLSDLVLAQPDTLEELLGIVETTLTTLPSEMPCVIVWDSVAATMTKQEDDAGATGDTGRMLQVPAMLSQRLRSVIKTLSPTNAAIIAINQTRTNPTIKFGDNTTTSGGSALKFYSSVRVRILGGAKAKDKGDEGAVIGKDITIECVKHKLAVPFKKVRVRLNYTTGWDNAWSTLGLAKDLEVVSDGLRGKNAHREALEALCKLSSFGSVRKPPLPPLYVPPSKAKASAEQVDPEPAAAE